MNRYLFLLVFTCFYLLGKAQTNCECTRGSLQTTGEKPLFYAEIDDDCTNASRPPNPFIYLSVEIRYFNLSCPGGITCHEIYDVTIRNNVENWIPPCLDTFIPNSEYWPLSNWVGFNGIMSPLMIHLMDSLLPGGHSDCITFPSGCFQLLDLSWPPGANYTILSDSGTKTVDLSNVKTTVLLPCGGDCCVLRASLDSNGVRIIEQLSTGTGGSCGTRDPSWTPPSVNGYTAIVDVEHDCEPICTGNGHPIIWSTNKDLKNKIKLQLSVKPTLVDDIIYFEGSFTPIEVLIFDALGKLIKTAEVTKNELVIQDLKSGIYYIQFKLSETDIRYLKVLKK